MAADENWPFDLLKSADPQVELMCTTVGGGRSFTGKLMPVAADPGYWSIILGSIWVRSNDQVLELRRLARRLQGRLGTINIPVYDSKRAPWPGGVPGAAITSAVVGNYGTGDTQIVIDMIAGANPQSGMFFSIGERLYAASAVAASSGGNFLITFLPPLRDAITNSEAVEWARPICRCRLVSDDTLKLALHLQRFASISPEFEEDV